MLAQKSYLTQRFENQRKPPSSSKSIFTNKVHGGSETQRVKSLDKVVTDQQRPNLMATTTTLDTDKIIQKDLLINERTQSMSNKLDSGFSKVQIKKATIDYDKNPLNSTMKDKSFSMLIKKTSNTQFDKPIY